MSPASKVNDDEDPTILAQEARALLGAGIDDRPPTIMEDSIRRAFKLVWPDLVKIDTLRQQKQEIDPTQLLGGQLQEKIAALLLITRHKLLDVANGSAQAQDIIDGRSDLSLFIDLFIRLNAADAFAILYDLSFAQQQQGQQVEFWQKACVYYLHLIARMTDARPRAIHFLKERPHARRQVEQLIGSPESAIAATFRTLGEDYVRARKEDDPTSAAPAPPAYLNIYLSFPPLTPDDQFIGFTSLLAAEQRIKKAVEHGDAESVSKWIGQGSPEASRLAFTFARESLPTSSFFRILELVLKCTELPLVTLSAVVLELGEVNRALHPHGGEETVNRMLADFACTREKRLVGIAKLAVQELRSANAFNDIVTVMEKTSIIEVAEEGMRMMCEMRRLPMVEAVVLRRPVLSLAFQQAQKHLLNIQELMHAAWSCSSDSTARVYMERLRELKAIPELEQLGKKHRHISDLANRTLAELRLAENSAPRR